MSTNRLKFWIAGAVLFLTILACGFSASTANVEEAYMASDYEGTNPTTTFAPEDTFYAIVDLANAPDDTVVRASWTAVEVQGEEPDLFLDEAEVTTGSGRVHFELSNENLWPSGSYKVEIYVNDEVETTLDFTVQ